MEVYSTVSLLLYGNMKEIGLGAAASVAGWFPEADGNHYNTVNNVGMSLPRPHLRRSAILWFNVDLSNLIGPIQVN